MANEEVSKISVSDFVERYLKISPRVQGPAGRDQYVKNIVVTDYIPFQQKVALVSRIVKATTQKSDGTFEQSSPIRYVLLIMEVIRSYTSLNIETDLSIYDDYDLLNRHGLIEVIMDKVPEKEYVEFKTLTDMIERDIIANKYESHVFFTELMNSFLEGANKIAEGLNPTGQDA